MTTRYARYFVTAVAYAVLAGEWVIGFIRRRLSASLSRTRTVSSKYDRRPNRTDTEPRDSAPATSSARTRK